MATGIIGVLNGVGTISYTPSTDAKVVGVFSAVNTAAWVSVQGVSNAIHPYNTGITIVEFFVGGGQTFTITLDANSSVVLTSLES